MGGCRVGVGGGWVEGGGQLNGRSMAGSSVGTFYCKPWDSSTVSGCRWRVGRCRVSVIMK